MADPIVEIKQGKLLGKIAENARGGNYYSFQGIPYAKPPLGDLRFKAPEAPLQWEGIRDATQEGSICYTKDLLQEGRLRGSEDCLFVNIYTPELPGTKGAFKNKPVMFWIHGGAFTGGSCQIAITGPDYLLKEDVVVVMVTYRTGVLGFLNFDDPSLEVPGNAGLKDIVMALRWVHENISVFGGDPNNVTIFGESAGGAAVHLLIASPLAKGLFHKAIAQSGSFLNPWVWGSSSAPLFAEVLGLKDWNEKQVLHALRNLPLEKLHETQQKIKDILCKFDTRRPIGPVIEAYENESTFLSEEPLNLIKCGNYNKVPFMTGYTSREGLVIKMPGASPTVDEICQDVEELVPYFLNLPKGSAKSKNIANQIKKFYFGDETPSKERMNPMYFLFSDISFAYGIHYAARQQSVTSSNPVYLYRFSVEGELNAFKNFFKITDTGASHADELGYLFKTLIPFTLNSIEDLTIKRISKIWTTFARNGNPNFKDPDLFNVEWRPVEKDRIHFLDIGENLTVGINPEKARMAFWDSILKNE